jgi:hypothetical protein
MRVAGFVLPPWLTLIGLISLGYFGTRWLREKGLSRLLPAFYAALLLLAPFAITWFQLAPPESTRANTESVSTRTGSPEFLLLIAAASFFITAGVCVTAYFLARWKADRIFAGAETGHLDRFWMTFFHDRCFSGMLVIAPFAAIIFFALYEVSASLVPSVAPRWLLEYENPALIGAYTTLLTASGFILSCIPAAYEIWWRSSE